MVLATKPRSMGSSWSGSFEFEEIIEEEEFYEEVVIEEDEEYEEIVIESPQGKKKGRLQATQEEVDSMSLQNAKLYLAALPDAKGQTSVPATYSDDDYEYEEIEIPDEITPIRRSRRNSLFGAPSLDTLDEGSERSERSNTSAIHSPNTTKKKELGVILRNINENSIQEEPAEFSEQEPSKSEQAEGQNSKEAITGADLSQPEDQEDDGPHSENHLSQKEIGVDTHDELGKGWIQSPFRYPLLEISINHPSQSNQKPLQPQCATLGAAQAWISSTYLVLSRHLNHLVRLHPQHHPENVVLEARMFQVVNHQAKITLVMMLQCIRPDHLLETRNIPSLIGGGPVQRVTITAMKRKTIARSSQNRREVDAVPQGERKREVDHSVSRQKFYKC